MSLLNFPSGPITPAGARKLLAGVEPIMGYVSPGGEISFNLMGAQAPVPGVQNGVTIQEIKGLTAIWQTQDQQGANQDGVTFTGAVYDPIVVDMIVEAHGNTPVETREVIRRWIEAWDVKKQGTLFTITEAGYWFAPVRWFKTPTEKIARAQSCRQRFSWTARADDGFWRSVDSTSAFLFEYEAMTDTFTGDYRDDQDLGPNWPQLYSGTGGGYCTSNGADARWVDDPDDVFLTTAREVINGPYKDFNTDTDNQVVSMVYASGPEWTFPEVACNDMWARMSRNVDGTWKGDGIRCRVEIGGVRISRYVNFVETAMYVRPLFIPPLPGEKFTFVAGITGSLRTFQLLRDNWTILSFTESGTASLVGPNYRGIGFGMRAAAAIITQATPGAIRKISAGDNAAVTQSGFLTLTNIGDQQGWHNIICYGPGTFEVANGPESANMVKFGPLLAGQIALLRTEPRRRGVYDLTPPDATVQGQELTGWQSFIKNLVTFATNGNVPPLLRQFESLFGILPPQGEFYSLLEGRFTKSIPAKPIGGVPVESHMAVKVTGGGPTTKVVAALTPLRRWPQ